MKFANKYELFEAVTSGRVETFFAKDLASGERVLLHIFEAPEKRPDQPTVIWVLESFRNVAPEPPGLVLDTGRYTGTTYAYLVTKLPDSDALQRWTQAYDSRIKETQGTSIPLAAPPPANPATLPSPPERPAESSLPTPTAKTAGDFAAVFSGLPSPGAPPSGANTASATTLNAITSEAVQTAPKREPGEFTRQFFSGLHEVPKDPGTPAPPKTTGEVVAPKPELPALRTRTQAAARTEEIQAHPSKPAPGSDGLPGGAAPIVSGDSGGFTALFRSDFKSETPAASESNSSPGKPADAKTGDFTNFFRGPFDGERPAETPAILPKPQDTPPRNEPGDFTRVFGSGKSNDLVATPPVHSPADFPRQDQATGSTQIFSGVGQPVAAPPANTPSQLWEPVASISPLSKEAAWTAPPPPRANPPIPPSIEPISQKPASNDTFRAPEPAGATHVFSVVRPPLSSPPPPAGGPSEYTRIISGVPSGITPAEKVPIVPPPAKLSPPAVPPPPKAPGAEIKAPKTKASYLPLVIVLNVLLFLAILLIVYFEVRH